MRSISKALAIICLITMIAPLFPYSTFAQEAVPSPELPVAAPEPTDTPTVSADVPSPASDPADAPVPSTEISPLMQGPSVTPDAASPVDQPPITPDTLAPMTSPLSQNSTLTEEPAPAMNQTFNQSRPLPAEINTNTGGLKYDYPITVPPGRNGLQPSLQLNYSTDDRDVRSIVGVGWSINIP